MTNKTEEEIKKELELEKIKIEEERKKQEKLFEEMTKNLEEAKIEENDNEYDSFNSSDDSKKKD